MQSLSRSFRNHNFINPLSNNCTFIVFRNLLETHLGFFKSGILRSGDYKSFWSTLLSKNVVSGENCQQTKNGRLVILRHDNPILDWSRKIIGFLGIHRDITDRKREEEDLEKSFSLIQATLESTRWWILVVDRIGTITNYNAQFARCGISLKTYMAEGKIERQLTSFLAQLTSPERFCLKSDELYSSSGRRKFWRSGIQGWQNIWTLFAIPHELMDGLLDGCGSFRDVTQRKPCGRTTARKWSVIAARGYFTMLFAVHGEGNLYSIQQQSTYWCNWRVPIIGMPIMNIHSWRYRGSSPTCTSRKWQNEKHYRPGRKFIRLDGSIMK